MMRLPFPFTWVFFAACSPAFAKVTPNPIFQDGAVLQRETPIPVWGTATREGEKITVTLGETSVSTEAKKGAWRVDLPPRPSGGGPLTLTIAGDDTVSFSDILMGEVWVCSGQSNMERQLGPRKGQQPLVDWEAHMAAANLPQIRLFTVRNAISTTPLTAVSGKWKQCSPATAKEFSAVGFYFGRDLHRALSGVPVGLISSTWGGTPAVAWTSRAALDDLSLRSGADPVKAPSGQTQKYNSPAALRNAMITPLMPYAIRGVIWYQGESDDKKAREYRKLFPALIADWRKDWGRGDFPFLFVQIAPHRRIPPELREAQFLTLAAAPSTAMIVTTDIGDANDIHPTRKEPVGARLALAARALAHGEKLEYSGPLFAGARFTGSRAVVSFTQVGAGLVAQSGEPKGFTLAGADRHFHPAQAKIVGDTLVVTSENVPAPLAVRYGWSNVPDVNLFNREGLPASPFRSDVD